MKGHRLFASFAVVATTAALAVVLTATASTALAATVGQSAVSANWAGYVAGGTQFSSVSGSWVQPTAKCGSGQAYSAFWVGLGGSDNQSASLEQTGTQADCNQDGSTDYYAWYELVPAGPVKLDLAIQPGDHITANVSVNGTNVTVSLSDETSGQSTTKTLQMDSPDTSSAEWIAEAPSSCDGSGSCQPLPLSDFGSVQFTGATATANGHTGTISDSNWSAQPVWLGASGASDVSFSSGGGSAGASPSSLSSDGSSFSVAVQSSASGTAGATGSSGDYGYGGGGDGYGGYPGGDGSYGYGGDPGGYGQYGYGDGGYGGGGYGGYGYGAF